MNSKVTGGMEIYFPTGKKTRKRWISDKVYDIVMSSLLFTVIFQTFIRIFGIECHALWLQTIGVFVIICISLFYDKRGVFPVFVLTDTVVFVIGMASKADMLVQGMNIVMNQVLHVLGAEKNVTFLQYTVECNENRYPDYAFLFLLFPMLLFAALSIGVIKSYRKIGLLLCMGAFVLQLYMQNIDVALLTIGLALCVVLILGADFVGNTKWKNVQGMEVSQQVLYQGVLLVLLFAVIVGVAAWMPFGENTDSFAKKSREGLTHMVKELRYEKNPPNTFTQGDFTRLTNLELYEVPALLVQMEEPDSYYLRGYVGSSYTKNGWEALGKEQIYDHYPLHYWLKENQFDELAQLSALEAVTENKEIPAEMHIRNLNANSEYLYTPYEFVSLEGKEKQIFSAGQGNLISRKFWGHRDYTYQVTENLLVRYPVLSQKLKDDDYKQYELNEREWVYDTYLEVPAEVKAVLKQILGERQSAETGHVTYQEAEKLIKTYLEKNITYSMTIEPRNQDVDFVTDFLKDSKTGYAVHYATAATLMFRYCGIPSRYVEGYLITPEDVADKKSGEEIEIQGKNGHAWTEIYQDGIGWIPVEVTPAYYGIMEVAQIPPQTAQSGTRKDGSQEEAGELPQDVEPPEQALEPQENGLLDRILKMAGIILLTLLVLGIIGVVAFLLLRRYLLQKRRKQQFESTDYNLAVCRIFEYMESLLKYEGIQKKGISPQTYREGIKAHISNAYAKQFDKIWKICQCGAFSTHRISEGQWKQVYEYQGKLLEKIMENKKWYQRWSMKYIRCFY